MSPSPYHPPSTAASQQSLETATVIFDSAYNSDHTPEETEDGAVGEQATAAAAATAAATEEGEYINVKLHENKLWQEFHKVGNEMVVTKLGR